MSRHAQGKQSAAKGKESKKAAGTQPAASAARQAEKSTGFLPLVMIPGASGGGSGGGGSADGAGAARGNGKDHGGGTANGGGSQKRPASGAPPLSPAGAKRVRAPSPQSQASEADKSAVQAAKVWARLPPKAQTLARMLEQLGAAPTSSVALRVKNFLPQALKLVSQLYPRLHAEGFHFLSLKKGGKERSLTGTVVSVLEKHTAFQPDWASVAMAGAGVAAAGAAVLDAGDLISYADEEGNSDSASTGASRASLEFRVQRGVAW
jgi:hypothetical protein